MYLVHAGRNRFQKPGGQGGPEQRTAGSPAQFLAYCRSVIRFLGDVGQNVHHDPPLEQSEEGQVPTAAVGHLAPRVFHQNGQKIVTASLH